MVSEHLHKKVDRNSAFFTQKDLLSKKCRVAIKPFEKVRKMTLFKPDERKTQPKTSLYLSEQNSEILWFSLVFKK